MNILVLHGPNLNLLGTRKPEIYGTQTLADLNHQLKERAKQRSVQLRVFQSNHEGALIDKMHELKGWMEGMIINPGAYTHYSYALRDAIEAVEVPTYEVHLSDIHARESWRRVSVLSDVVVRQITGKGFGSYFEALDRLSSTKRGEH